MPQTRCFGPIIEAIASNSEEGVILIDENGEVCYANAAAASKLGVTGPDQLAAAKQLGSLNLPRAIIRAQIKSGKPDAAGELHKEFIEFQEHIGSKEAARLLRVRTGVVELPSPEKSVRLVLLREQSEPGKKLNEEVVREQGLWIGRSLILAQILEYAKQIAPSSANVLIQGEIGTGKAKLAGLIHRLSGLNNRPLTSIDCAGSNPATLAEQLFGSSKMSVQPRNGAILRANHGTLFLRNIDKLPLETQAELSNILHEQQLSAAHSDEIHHIYLRIIASSTKPLMEEVQNGRFHHKLYYKISLVPFYIPPLRERQEDIPLLADHFRKRVIQDSGLEDIILDDEVIDQLRAYPWPGNIPELMNSVEHCLICATNGHAGMSSLPRNIQHHTNRPFHSSLQQIEADNDSQMKQAIKEALKKAKGNKSETAKILDIDRTTLWRRMRRLDIKHK